jgi:acetyl esterase/lipase
MRYALPTVVSAALASFLIDTSAASAQRLRPRDVDTLPSRAPDAVVSYGTDSLQVGELRLPKGQGPFPLVVVIHGGCWTRGFATRRNTAAVASALADDGMATWNVEYRQAGDPGGGWPNSFLDIASAVDHARTLATRYPIDTSHVVVIGHSAGAHLALWAAARHTLPANSVVRGGSPLRVRAAVAIDGPGDLAGLVGRDAEICGKPVIAPFMGGTPSEVSARYAEGSPLARLPIGAAQYLVSATVLTADEAKAYQAAAQRAGDRVTLLDSPEGGHFGVIAPGTRFWPPVAAFIRHAVGLHR